MLQLNPMIPIFRVSDEMEGYAFLVIDYSQEHNVLFTCAMDNGEIWTLSNKEIRFCKNISLDRKLLFIRFYFISFNENSFILDKSFYNEILELNYQDEL